jgi:transposase
MDMSNAYAKWVGDNLLNATVVYDHFHVIQLMNKKLDQVRRKVQGMMEGEAHQRLKGKRWLLLPRPTTSQMTKGSRWRCSGMSPRTSMTPGR